MNKENKCKCGHNEGTHAGVYGNCLHSAENKSIDVNLFCTCKKFEAHGCIYCGHLHSKDIPCIKHENHKFYCFHCKSFFEELHNHSHPKVRQSSGDASGSDNSPKEERAIQKFADAMTKKMLKRRKRYKEFGWRDPEYKSITDLKIHLRQEIQEWEDAQEDLDELVDIANSCFMLWDRLKLKK